MMVHPQAVLGLSDGGAHCGLICDASMPTFLLTHWVRDRQPRRAHPARAGGGGADPRHRRASTASTTAACSRPGMKADVNVIDFERLHLHAPEMVYDLPADGRRLIQRVDGYAATVQSGEVTYEDGAPTGALPGHLLRGPQQV